MDAMCDPYYLNFILNAKNVCASSVCTYTLFNVYSINSHPESHMRLN